MGTTDTTIPLILPMDGLHRRQHMTTKRYASKAGMVKPNLLTAALLAPYAMNFVKGLMKEQPDIAELHIIVKRRKQ